MDHVLRKKEMILGGYNTLDLTYQSQDVLITMCIHTYAFTTKTETTTIPQVILTSEITGLRTSETNA